MAEVMTVVAEVPTTGSCIVVQQSTQGDADGIVRDLVETVARELEALHRFLKELYDSAFVETGSGAQVPFVITIVDLEREPRVLAQINAVVSEPEPGRLEFQTSRRGLEQAVLPELFRCKPVRRDRD